MNFEKFLNESINDAGLFKAIFVVGIPGAGKSYTVSQLSGSISPKIVNTDIALEFLSKKSKMDATGETWKTTFGDKTKKITSERLYNYLNGMLPLFIDGTSSNYGNIVHRTGILESLGYDVGMIFINTDVETSITRSKERAEKIGRHVDEKFIRDVFDRSTKNKEFFKNKYKFFKEIDNNDGELTDSIILKAYKEVQAFYSGDILNPDGEKYIEEIEQNKEKYLSDSIFTKEVIIKKVEGWYKN